MRASLFFPVLAWVGLGGALPANNCSTVTTTVIVPSTTATYKTTDVITKHPSTAENLGTFTYVTTISTTTTLETMTSTVTACIATSIVTQPMYATIYTTASPNPYKRNAGLTPSSCTLTSTTTSLYGQTYTFVPANRTSTFYAYTAFSQATVTQTSQGGRAYAIATARTTRTTPCGNATTTAATWTVTRTRDARCAPSALTSAYSSFGLASQDDVPLGGATYVQYPSAAGYGNVVGEGESGDEDASACCQRCAEAESCSASSFDVRTGECRLEFAVDAQSGRLECGEGLLAFYDYGPISPMAPGAGLWVAALCGNVQFGAAAPDDGS